MFDLILLIISAVSTITVILRNLPTVPISKPSSSCTPRAVCYKPTPKGNRQGNRGNRNSSSERRTKAIRANYARQENNNSSNTIIRPTGEARTGKGGGFTRGGGIGRR